MKATKNADVDAYIAGFPDDVQQVLEKVRAAVKKGAPHAGEVIKYNMPAYTLHGNLVFFAGFKNHIGFYDLPADEDLANELSSYKQGKGSVQFPFSRPIPYSLITKIVKVRVKENVSKKDAGKG